MGGLINLDNLENEVKLLTFYEGLLIDDEPEVKLIAIERLPELKLKLNQNILLQKIISILNVILKANSTGLVR